MIIGDWISQALGESRVLEASTEASRRRLYASLGLSGGKWLSDEDLRFVVDGLELRVFDLLDKDTRSDALCQAAAEVFQIARALPWPEDPLEAGDWLVRIGCLSVLGDRGADFRRMLLGATLPILPLNHESWGVRVWASILEVWLRLLRKQGWEDFDAVQHRIAA